MGCLGQCVTLVTNGLVVRGQFAFTERKSSFGTVSNKIADREKVFSIRISCSAHGFSLRVIFGVLFFLFFAYVDFVGFGFYVVEHVKRRTAVRSD